MLQKKPVKIWNVNADDFLTSKLVKTKTISKYLTGYLDITIRVLVLIMPKISGSVKKFQVKDWDKDKNNRLMSFNIDDDETKIVVISINI